MSDGYGLGLASMTEKPNPSKRRSHKAERQDKEKLASSFQVGTQSQGAKERSQNYDEDVMEIE